MLKKILYILWSLIFIFIIIFTVKSGSFLAFIDSMENTTFDIRQKIQVKSNLRKHNKDIVIVAIDDGSYEYILDKYGEWPLNRKMYAKMVDYIEAQNPKAIAFDLMFVKSMKSDSQSDLALTEIFKKYDNVYTAMNLDNQETDLRTAPELPSKLEYKEEVSSKYTPMEYTNCRMIIQGIIDATSNIGMINVSRSNDGVLREMPVFLKYRDKYYPQLGYLIGKKYSDNPQTDKLPITQNGSVILNWYGGSGTFEQIPVYKLLLAADGKNKFDYDFKNKIVYFGATAASLFDIKTVPTDKVLAGVEVQTTYVNNLLDGSLIKKAGNITNLLIGILLALITALIVLKIESMFAACAIAITIYAIYDMLMYILMGYYHLWVGIVIPVILGISTLILTLIIKYLIKSKDFDRQYKLATTDGLTDLYNHRYFQEQLKNQVQHSTRYNTEFSLIILDIDFFKKFNDTYGHQSGDAVLRQVASVLKKNVRMTDIVCRYGGEEISIILPNTTYDEANLIAEKLCRLVGQKKYKLSNGRESNVTISLGVSAYGADGKTPSDIIEAADKRLYNAKNNGRNRVN